MRNRALPAVVLFLSCPASLLVPAWCACALDATSSYAEDGGSDRAHRALPPAWSPAVVDTFFADAREQLRGKRPDYPFLARSVADPAVTPSIPEVPGAEPQEGMRWPQFVRAQTLEDEVKRISRQTASAVSSPTEFKGGSYQECRRHFSVLAVLFAVIGQYEGEVRWRDEAPSYRVAFARAGFNCKVGTDQSFREAQIRSEDLLSIIRGGRVDAPSAERDVHWKEVTDRPPLMQRMEIAQQEKLDKWLSGPTEFRANRDEIRHESEMLAILAQVISGEGFKYSDEHEFQAYAEELRDAAQSLGKATEADDYDLAFNAFDTVTKLCMDCHEDYRN